MGRDPRGLVKVEVDARSGRGQKVREHLDGVQVRHRDRRRDLIHHGRVTGMHIALLDVLRGEEVCLGGVTGVTRCVLDVAWRVTG